MRGRRFRAFAASVLLHLAGAVVLWLVAARPRPPGAPEAPAATPIEIAVEEPPPSPGGAPEGAPPAPPRGPRPKAPSTPHPIPESPPAPAENAPPAPPVAPRVPSGPTDLSFDALAAGAKEQLAGPRVPGVDVLLRENARGGRAPGSVDELRAEAERQADAEANVRLGRAHPALFTLLRGARTRLEPRALAIADTIPLGPSLSVEGWARGYLERVRQRPGARDDRSGRELDNPAADRHSDIAGAYSEAERQAAAGAEHRTAEVCLVVAPDQQVSVQLRRSSTHADLDQAAIESFEKAATVAPLPEDVKPGVACYTVRITAFRMPPLPSLSLGLKKGRPEIIYPLKRITKLTVELNSVDIGRDERKSTLLR